MDAAEQVQATFGTEVIDSDTATQHHTPTQKPNVLTFLSKQLDRFRQHQSDAPRSPTTSTSQWEEADYILLLNVETKDDERAFLRIKQRLKALRTLP